MSRNRVPCKRPLFLQIYKQFLAYKRKKCIINLNKSNKTMYWMLLRNPVSK